MKIKAAFYLLTCFAAAPASAADSLYLRYFAGAASGKPCYARYYNDAHLKAHPKQKVRRIEIDFDASWPSEEDRKSTDAEFQTGIGFTLKRSREWYGR